MVWLLVVYYSPPMILYLLQPMRNENLINFLTLTFVRTTPLPNVRSKGVLRALTAEKITFLAHTWSSFSPDPAGPVSKP
jgi:hypothetical protein